MDGFLAIDVAKDKLDARLSLGLADPGSEFLDIQNTTKGFRKLLSEAKRRGITKLYVCMEATGAYWYKLAKYFFDAGATVYVVNPARIKGQRKTEHRRSKTDRIDTGVILRFLKAQLTELFPWVPPTPAVRKLQGLVRFRESLVSERTAKKNLIKSCACVPMVMQKATKQIACLDRDIAEIEKAIVEVIKSDTMLLDYYRSIISVPFVAEVTAPIILSELRAFAEVKDPRQATAFAGLDVVEESSGTLRKPPRISKQGNALLRMALFRVAPAAVQKPGQFREFYLRLIARGLKRKQALVAVARKLLEITVAVAVSGQTFDRLRYKTT